ncbi:hypothetical protein HK102_006248 [Quaeritorhiza haematococci]|nr:hypothetical protein HK102_006248 [Quaeritorhiza haematococci]
MHRLLKLALFALAAIIALTALCTTGPVNAAPARYSIGSELKEILGKARVKLYLGGEISTFYSEREVPHEVFTAFALVRPAFFSSTSVTIQYADADGTWSPTNIIRGSQFRGPSKGIYMYSFERPMEKFARGISAFKIVYDAGMGRRFVDDNGGEGYPVRTRKEPEEERQPSGESEQRAE